MQKLRLTIFLSYKKYFSFFKLEKSTFSLEVSERVTIYEMRNELILQHKLSFNAAYIDHNVFSWQDYTNNSIKFAL